MEFRQIRKDDLKQFLEMRMEFAALMREIPDMKSFRDVTETYLEEHIGKDDLVVVLAVDSGQIISSCMACIFQTAPLPSCPSGKIAELLNVYTKKDHRGNGYVTKLIRMLMEELKSRGVGKIILSYTDAGYPVYKKLGFTEENQEMSLTL
ncbi:MAG TPA: GNAT family N-acetyltransferase [Lachnospiraceae bacterium]|nr:GNAT family N-acetyltransferase [Lachnospiraceae bacterium]